MTTDEWLAAVLADAPPLTPGQLTALRPLAQAMTPRMRTAPAETRAARDISKTDPQEGIIRERETA